MLDFAAAVLQVLGDADPEIRLDIISEEEADIPGMDWATDQVEMIGHTQKSFLVDLNAVIVRENKDLQNPELTEVGVHVRSLLFDEPSQTYILRERKYEVDLHMMVADYFEQTRIVGDLGRRLANESSLTSEERAAAFTQRLTDTVEAALLARRLGLVVFTNAHLAEAMTWLDGCTEANRYE
ncbi:MAG: hypothetical protein JWN38_80 [Candidatus Saccharibacteria bacterium]|nr:hypothetical protein [Candidatus Saccharibacteria bacterium]